MKISGVTEQEHWRRDRTGGERRVRDRGAREQRRGQRGEGG